MDNILIWLPKAEERLYNHKIVPCFLETLKPDINFFGCLTEVET